MATTLTGNAANGSQHPIQVAAPAAGEAAASGPMATLLQKILDGIAYLRSSPAFAGKPTATATVAGDGSTTLTTKGYADATFATKTQTSGSSGSFSTTSTSAVDVTNLAVTITTAGRPVVMFLQPAAGSFSSVSRAAAGTGSLTLRLLRGATEIAASTAFATSANLLLPPGVVHHLDTPVAGTYTYKVQASTSDAATEVSVTNCVLVAIEL